VVETYHPNVMLPNEIERCAGGITSEESNVRTVFLTLVYFLLALAPASAAGTVKAACILFENNFAKLTDDQIITLSNEFKMVMSAQWKFDILAANERAASLKRENSTIILLAFMSSEFLRKKQSQYDECNSEEDLFAHSAYPYTSEDRITTEDLDAYLMDVSNREWSDKIISWYRALSADWDGLILDDGGPHLVQEKLSALPYGYSHSTYRSAKNSHQEYIEDQTDTIVIFNGMQFWDSYPQYSDDLNGGVIEGFALGPSHPTSDHDWIENCVNVFLQNSEKYCGAWPKHKDRFTTEERIFALACYLLAMHNNSYYTLYQHPRGSLSWYPEYRLDIGVPLTTPSKLDDMLDVSGLYVRDFTKGKVLVNSSNSPKNYKLSQTYWKVEFSGGGLINNDGKYSGKILSEEQSAGTVSLPAGSALILSSYNQSKSDLKSPSKLQVK